MMFPIVQFCPQICRWEYGLGAEVEIGSFVRRIVSVMQSPQHMHACQRCPLLFNVRRSVAILTLRPPNTCRYVSPL